MGEVFQTAYEELREMGHYHFFNNNCQDCAKQLAKALGAPKEHKTDVETTISKGTVIALSTLAIIVGYQNRSKL